MMDIVNYRLAAHRGINRHKGIAIVEGRKAIIGNHRALRQQRVAHRFGVLQVATAQVTRLQIADGAVILELLNPGGECSDIHGRSDQLFA